MANAYAAARYTTAHDSVQLRQGATVAPTASSKVVPGGARADRDRRVQDDLQDVAVQPTSVRVTVAQHDKLQSMLRTTVVPEPQQQR